MTTRLKHLPSRRTKPRVARQPTPWDVLWYACRVSISDHLPRRQRLEMMHRLMRLIDGKSERQRGDR